MLRGSYVGLWLCWALLLLSGALLVGGDFWRDFLSGPRFSNVPQFSHEGLFLSSVGLDDIDGYIAAFGDFNADTFVDVFVVSADQSLLQVHTWRHDLWRFRELEGTNVSLPNIVSVIPADFDGDGRLDVLVQGRVLNNSSQLYARILPGHLRSFDTFSTVELPPSVAPLAIFDYNGDLLPDLIGIPANVNASPSLRALWLNGGASSNWTTLPLAGQLPLSPHHAHSYVDLDGDCRPDQVLIACAKPQDVTCDSIVAEIWLSGATEFNLAHSIPLPSGTQHVSFSDLNGDGAVDAIYVVCQGTRAPPRSALCDRPRVEVLLNEQIPLCQGLVTLNSVTCKPLSALCTADPKFRFSAPVNLFPTTNAFNVSLRASAQTGLVRVRLGDLNLDGYPDILLVAQGDSDDSESTFLQLWHNLECSGTCANSSIGNTAGRAFALDSDAHTQSVLRTSVAGVHDAAFFDLDETGALDVLVARRHSNGVLGVSAIYNNQFLDAFFLKALGLNGACVSNCPSAPRFPKPKPYGVNAYGPTFTFTVTQMNGQRRLAHGTQLTQATHLALETPYQLFGLGRTNNYIEMIYLGTSIRPGLHFNSWTPVIPNTQLVAIPYPPSAPLQWTLESYIAPSGVTLWVAVAVLTALVANAAVIWFFRWREQLEDEREKKASAHLFSFEAMG